MMTRPMTDDEERAILAGPDPIYAVAEALACGRIDGPTADRLISQTSGGHCEGARMEGGEFYAIVTLLSPIDSIRIDYDFGGEMVEEGR